MPVIGFLHAQSEELNRDWMPAFYKGLAERGFVEGRNVVIEHRWAEGHAERRQTLAADLVRRQVSVIIADTTLFAQVAKAATQIIPIVFFAGGDPVEFGLVASLNRPGGNATGVAMLGAQIMSKRLELLHKLVPGAGPIGMFIGAAGNQFTEAETRDLQSAARTLGIQVALVNVVAASDRTGVDSANELGAGFSRLAELKARALLLSANVFFQQERNQVALLAARHALPTMFWERASVTAGAFASYGPDFLDAYHQWGDYVGRVLKGEKPADLPVVQPAKFELVFNLKTAKVLGIEIPPMMLALADHVIE